MLYALIVDGVVVAYPYKLSTLRKDNPNTSFPVVPSSETLARFNVYPVEDGEAPAADTTEAVIEEMPVIEAGKLKRKFHKRQKTQEEISSAAAVMASEVLARREAMLRDTDWTQAGDAPPTITNAYRAYRKALWDLEKQPGFPFTIDWPVKP